MADDDKNPGLTVIGAVFGLFAGFAALITIGGAALLALRLRFERVPAPSVFASEISRDAVLATGMTQLVLPLALVAAIYLALRGGRRSSRGRPKHGRLRRVWWFMGTSTRRLLHGWWWVVWWIVGTVLLAAPGLIYHHYSKGFVPIVWPSWWPVIGVVACSLAILAALRIRQNLLEHSFVTDWGFNRAKAVLTLTLLWTLTALPGALFYGSAAPFDEVTVCNHAEPINGFLIGQSADRIFIGEKEEDRRVLSIGLDKIDAYFVGAPAGDCANSAILPSPTDTAP